MKTIPDRAVPATARPVARQVVLPLVFALAALAGCAAPTTSDTAPSGDCPVPAVPVTVSVQPWGEIASELGGDCVQVTTIVAAAAGDPHEYEPTTSDAASFAAASVVVLNGRHYDDWASKFATEAGGPAQVVSAADTTAAAKVANQNPHLWYDPATVHATSAAITAAYAQAAPAAADYFAARAQSWDLKLRPYDELVASLRTDLTGRTYGATEGVFDPMAAALELVDRTPAGWAQASANESEPAPADLHAFTSALAAHSLDVLVFNAQTEGALPDQVRAAAQAAAVPVLAVTETMPAGKTFLTWQLGQLNALGQALEVKS